MTTTIKVVAKIPPAVAELTKVCEEVSTQSNLERCEIAVAARLERGIPDDLELKQVDALLGDIVRGDDKLSDETKPTISQAYALHKMLIAAVAPFHQRWQALRDKLSKLMLDYDDAKKALAARQQAELDKAAAEQRLRDQALARAAMRNGDVAAAEAALERAMAPTPVIMAAMPALEHGQRREPWDAEITDPMAVCRAIVAGEIPVAIIKEWNITLIKREAAARNGLDWPGVRAWQEKALSVRRG